MIRNAFDAIERQLNEAEDYRTRQAQEFTVQCDYLEPTEQEKQLARKLRLVWFVIDDAIPLAFRSSEQFVNEKPLHWRLREAKEVISEAVNLLSSPLIYSRSEIDAAMKEQK